MIRFTKTDRPGRYVVSATTGVGPDVEIGIVERYRDRTPVLTTDRGVTYAIGHTERTTWRAFLTYVVPGDVRGRSVLVGGSFPTRAAATRALGRDFDALNAAAAERERIDATRNAAPGSPAAYGWTVVAGTDDAPRIVRGSDGITRYRNDADAYRAADETAARLRGRRVRRVRDGIEIGIVRAASPGGIGLSGLDGTYWHVTLSVESRSGTTFVHAESVETVD